jgi:hypothetical protein
MTPDILPGRLLVIGLGAIGIEFASFYRTLGSEVTIVEALDRILPVEDAEISAFHDPAVLAPGYADHDLGKRGIPDGRRDRSEGADPPRARPVRRSRPTRVISPSASSAMSKAWGLRRSASASSEHT